MTALRSGVAALLVAAALVLIAPVPPASACSCAVQSRAEHVDNALAVFAGTLAERERHGQIVAYTFDVHEVFKGSVTSTAEVSTGAQGSACGLPDLTPGDDYLVFAAVGGEHEGLRVSSCGGTVGAGPTPMEQVERLTGHRAAPEPGGPAVEDDPFFPYWSMAMIVIGTAVLVLLAFRRARA